MMHYLDRRSLIRHIVVLAGATAAPHAAARALFEGSGSLSAETMALLTAVADTLIPATDTPGAAAAGVPAMFGKLLANWAAASRRAELLKALNAIDAQAGGGFAALPARGRFDALDAFDKAHAGDAGYARLKELLVSLYYFSEIGATAELRYEHAPGAWEPSIAVDSDTRTAGGPAGA